MVRAGAVDQLLAFLPGFDGSHIPCLKKPAATV